MHVLNWTLVSLGRRVTAEEFRRKKYNGRLYFWWIVVFSRHFAGLNKTVQWTERAELGVKSSTDTT